LDWLCYDKDVNRLRGGMADALDLGSSAARRVGSTPTGVTKESDMNKIEAIKNLREVTGLGLAECKAALEATDWDADKALNYAKEHVKPSDKPVGAGAVFSYIHHNKTIGVLLELHCGTDFVTRSEGFQKLGNDLVVHIAGMDPKDVDDLLAQPYLRDTSLTVGDLIKQQAAKFNEPIKVSRFNRYFLGC
jgi:elongation factor Ts